MREVWDRIGISASLICVAHCLATPALVMISPIFSEFLSHSMFHLIIMMVVIPVATWALWNGYRIHRLRQVLMLGSLGVLIMALSITLSHKQIYETIGMIVAGLLLASAHLLNLKACRLER